MDIWEIEHVVSSRMYMTINDVYKQITIVPIVHIMPWNQKPINWYFKQITKSCFPTQLAINLWRHRCNSSEHWKIIPIMFVACFKIQQGITKATMSVHVLSSVPAINTCSLPQISVNDIYDVYTVLLLWLVKEIFKPEA